MRNRTYEDNYVATIKGVAQLILDAAPRGLSPRYRAELQRVADSGESSWSINAEFERAGREATCDLSARLESVDYKGKEDAEGNLWSEYRLEVKVNWPSHGSTEPNMALTRLELMREVAIFAAEVQATFSRPVMKMQETKAERDERARKAEEARVLRLLETICNGSLKGLRVGSETLVTKEDHGVPLDTYTFSANDKTYVARVGASAIVVTRAS